MSETNGKQLDGYYFSRVNGESGHRSKRHYHRLCEIYFMKEGACEYFIENRTFQIYTFTQVYTLSRDFRQIAAIRFQSAYKST